MMAKEPLGAPWAEATPFDHQLERFCADLASDAVEDHTRASPVGGVEDGAGPVRLAVVDRRLGAGL